MISSGGSSTVLHTRGKLDMQYGRAELTAKILSNRDDVTIRIHLLPSSEISIASNSDEPVILIESIKISK